MDVNDRAVEGGILDQYTMGLSWWGTRRWRIRTDYGITNLDRFGSTGITQKVHTRFQWVY